MEAGRLQAIVATFMSCDTYTCNPSSTTPHATQHAPLPMLAVQRCRRMLHVGHLCYLLGTHAGCGPLLAVGPVSQGYRPDRGVEEGEHWACGCEALPMSPSCEPSGGACGCEALPMSPQDPFPSSPCGVCLTIRCLEAGCTGSFAVYSRYPPLLQWHDLPMASAVQPCYLDRGFPMIWDNTCGHIKL